MSEQEKQCGLPKIVFNNKTPVHKCLDPKIQKLTISTVGKDVEQQELPFTASGEYKNTTATSEDCVAVSYEAKHTI